MNKYLGFPQEHLRVNEALQKLNPKIRATRTRMKIGDAQATSLRILSIATSATKTAINSNMYILLAEAVATLLKTSANFSPASDLKSTLQAVQETLANIVGVFPK